MTDLNKQDAANTAQRIESAEKDIAENRTQVTETKEQMVTLNTQVINDCEKIILSALESYVETGSYEEFKSTVEAQLQVIAGEINIKVSELESEIQNVDGDLQEKFSTITKWFTFDINGLTIGQVDNPYKIVIDNDRLSMLVSNVEVLWMDVTTREVYTPELTVTDKLKALGYLIEEDAEGNVNCDYIGGEA